MTLQVRESRKRHGDGQGAVEEDSSRIGTNVTRSEIEGAERESEQSDDADDSGRSPVLQVGSFEGGQFSDKGQATTNNLLLVDGQKRQRFTPRRIAGHAGERVDRLDGGSTGPEHT